MTWQLKRPTTSGKWRLKQADVALIADYPGIGSVTVGTTFANGSLAGIYASDPPDLDSIIDLAGGNWRTPANSNVLLGVPNGLSPSVGTFNEAARNTDPGEAHVEQDTDYKIRGVDKVGTLIPFPDAPEGTGTAALANRYLRLLLLLPAAVKTLVGNGDGTFRCYQSPIPNDPGQPPVYPLISFALDKEGMVDGSAPIQQRAADVICWADDAPTADAIYAALREGILTGGTGGFQVGDQRLVGVRQTEPETAVTDPIDMKRGVRFKLGFAMRT